MMWVFYVALGLSAGIASGFFGIGGGVILIPAFIYLIGLTQHQAQGTTLAIMVLPIGLLAALKYYFYGNVRLDIAAWVCIGFFVGGYFGALWAHAVSEPLLKKLFGVFLLLVSLRMIFAR